MAQLSDVIFCNNCGHQLRETWKFCSNCGSSMKIKTQEQSMHESLISYLSKLQAHLEQCNDPECHLRIACKV